MFFKDVPQIRRSKSAPLIAKIVDSGYHQRRSEEKNTMGKFQSFLDGFASAWDFTRPFSEKAKIRRQNVPFDTQWTQELGLDVPCWEEVANCLNNAIESDERLN